MTETNGAALARFRQKRLDSLGKKPGFLTLISSDYLTEPGQKVFGVPGIFTPKNCGETVIYQAEAKDGVRLGDQLVDGKVSLKNRSDSGFLWLEIDSTKTASVEGKNPPMLRVWDSDSPYIAKFSGLDCYPYNPDMIFRARFIPRAETVDFEHILDEGGSREHQSPGEVAFDYQGGKYSLKALKHPKGLQLVIADATTGQESYGGGRFLFTSVSKDGEVELDFNFLLTPPCGFSPAFNCPMPPASNRLPFPIRAGEKKVLSK